MNQWLKCLCIIGVCLALACSGANKNVKKENYPASFNVAIRSLSTGMFSSIKNDLGIFSKQCSVIIDPFIDAHTQEEPEVSARIEKVIIDTAKNNFPDYSVERMNPENLNDADYIISGLIRLDVFEGNEKSAKSEIAEKIYRIFATVRDVKSGEVISGSDVWVSDLKMRDYKPQQVYQDSPFYDIVETTRSAEEGQSRENEAEIEKNEQAAKADEDYQEKLKIKALLTKAGDAYNQEKYEDALRIFEQIAQMPGGQNMRTFAGLYMANLRLENMKAAGEAFEKLVAISVEKNNKLTVKFTFSVNSVNFWNDSFLVKQYNLWLRKIGEYFNQSHDCLKIVGHCSKTGSKEWNYRLSKLRAERIQKRLKPYFSNVFSKSDAIGKGFDENIIGIGTDDERDALDRRVEFIVIDCND